MRADASVVRNFGLLLVEMAACVPDGIVCFFTRYLTSIDLNVMSVR